jgi:hypothetical protein
MARAYFFMGSTSSWKKRTWGLHALGISKRASELGALRDFSAQPERANGIDGNLRITARKDRTRRHGWQRSQVKPGRQMAKR